MTCLVDTDIFAKLTICNLFDNALAALGFDRSHVLVLPEARDRLRVGRRWDKAVELYGVELANRILNSLDSVRVLSESFDIEDLLIFENCVRIHTGERLLILASMRHPKATMLSGDKQCLIELASEPSVRHVAEQLKGRIVCFEQLIHMIIEREGYEFVLQKVIQALPFDGALRLIFSQRESTKKEEAIYGLKSCIRAIKALEIDFLGNIGIPDCEPGSFDLDLE